MTPIQANSDDALTLHFIPSYIGQSIPNCTVDDRSLVPRTESLNGKQALRWSHSVYGKAVKLTRPQPPRPRPQPQSQGQNQECQIMPQQSSDESVALSILLNTWKSQATLIFNVSRLCKCFFRAVSHHYCTSNA